MDRESESVRKTLENASRRVVALEEALEALVKNRLNRHQLQLLSKLVENEGLLYYRLVQKLSCDLHEPPSTIRWNIRKLRDAGLIVAGTRNNKGVPVKTTLAGRLVLRAARNGDGCRH